MTECAAVFDGLAVLLSYPLEDYPEAAETCRRAIGRHAPEVAPLLHRFFEQVRTARLEDLEELYTRTFDLNPVCSLEVGWHLYGEDYNRGAFMVSVRQQLRAVGIAETEELPDHLSNVLPLLGRLEGPEAAEFSRSFVLPALSKMAEAITGKNNPFEDVMHAVRKLIEASAEEAARSQPEDGTTTEEATAHV